MNSPAVASVATHTLIDALVAALGRAGTYNRNDQEPPSAVLWTDLAREWEAIVPLLRGRLSLLTLGPYAPEDLTGPAYWIRSAIVGALIDVPRSSDETPVIYLPGVGRQDLRAVEECSRALQPLADLQYRGVLWTHKNGRDWTVAAFLQSADGGLGIELGGDNATREALARALMQVAEEPLERLRRAAPLRAPFFDGLLTPDEPRALLRWMNDPPGVHARTGAPEWSAFCAMARRTYNLDPERDGEVQAAALLGGRRGAWDTVWERFAESPHAYPRLPELLHRAHPAQPLSMFEPVESWPQENDAAEDALRVTLRALDGAGQEQARHAVTEAESAHGERRGWVWATLGRSPLAGALKHLIALAHETARVPRGESVEATGAAYADWGWRADAAAIYTLAAIDRPDDAAAVQAAVNALYRPWLEACAEAMQAVVAGNPAAYPHPGPMPAAQGTCLLFTDGLRMDVAHRLVAALEVRGLTCEVGWRAAALPTVTATAKPDLAPVPSVGAGPELEAAGPSGSRLTADALRRLLETEGVQPLTGGDTGDPAGCAWTEHGDIDGKGHDQGVGLAGQIDAEVRGLAGRIGALLDTGWRRVVVVTDHGWLLLPGGLPVAHLPEHLTVIRKGRCARLKPDSTTEMAVVPWRWDASERIALAPGIRCFVAGRAYEHGGVSPQECIAPVLTVTTAVTAQGVTIADAAWRGMRCAVTVTGDNAAVVLDLRVRPGDPASSLLRAPVPVQGDGARVLVEDDDHLGTAAAVVALDAGGRILAQSMTVVGG